MSKGDGTSMGDRFKAYEKVFIHSLPRRMPVILRVDGRAFHTITRKRFGKKWSMEFTEQMIETAKALINETKSNFCYCQSDEISLLLTDYRTINTEPWFDYNINKMVSISASIAASTFSRIYGNLVCFDSRVFSLPMDEVCNYFIWRQRDYTRNAVQMAGREHFSHKELQNKNGNEIQELLFSQKQINFNDYPIVRKRGFSIVNKEVNLDIPIFSQDRKFVEDHVYVRED